MIARDGGVVNEVVWMFDRVLQMDPSSLGHMIDPKRKYDDLFILDDCVQDTSKFKTHQWKKSERFHQSCQTQHGLLSHPLACIHSGKS